MTKKNQSPTLSQSQQRSIDSVYDIRPIEIAKFDDYYYMRKLAQLNHNLGFCTTLADYSYAAKTDRDQLLSRPHKLADCTTRKLVLAAFADSPAGHEQTVGMTGLSYSPRDSKGAVMVYLWGVYVEKPHRGRGLAKRMIAAALSRITHDLGCSDEDLVMTVLDSPFDGGTKGENRIDQGLGFHSDPISQAS